MAKESTVSWKMKAIERREENELLKERLENLEGKVNKLEGLLNQTSDQRFVDELKRQLEIANNIIAHQQKEILELKKKSR
jgi:polyhydroxyalkanoate synthesis regulator phasin